MNREVSCLNTRVIVEFVKRHLPDLMDWLLLDLDPFFDTIPDVEEFLLDEHNWISQEVCVKLLERVREHSGQPDIPRLIGRESVIHRRFGYLETVFIKAIGNPYLSILRAPYINAKLNKTKTVEIVSVDHSRAVIRLRWHEGMGSTKDICLYNQGFYEAIPTIWGLPPATIVEHSCHFLGDEYCEYEFTWVRRSIFKSILGLFTRRQDMLKDSIAEIERAKGRLARKYLEVENLNKELHQRIDQLTSLNACSKATTSLLDADMLLDVVMSLISNVMHFDRALILMVDEEKRRLMPVKGFGGEADGELERIKGYGVPLDRTQNILARVVDSGIAQVVTDVDHSFLRKENVILKQFNPKSFVAVPLITRNRVIGVLAAERLKGLEHFSSNDLDYLMNFANQIAISLENARLINSMKQSFVSSILSLASALEAKDPNTRGHSNRVATYSTILARRLGLDEDRVESLRLMALMHDIGKIGVPDQIINKPGKLTEEERDIVRSHPIHGARIIEPLLENNPELRHVRSHHERYDGRGYPDGLSGDAIPLEARIMNIADSFDAMTSSRPYRDAMTRADALREVERNKGTQFFPDIADLFIDILTSMPDDLCRLIADERRNQSVLIR